MKLIMENWKRFLKENESEEEESKGPSILGKDYKKEDMIDVERETGSPLVPEDHEEFYKQVVNLIKNSYKNIGGYPGFGDPETDWRKAKDKFTYFVSDIDADPDIDLLLGYYNDGRYLKASAIATDGERTTINFLKTTLFPEFFKKKHAWIEVSDAPAAIAVKEGYKIVTDSVLAEWLVNLGECRQPPCEFTWHGEHPTSERIGGEGWYTRSHFGSEITKMIVGNVDRSVMDPKKQK